MFIDELTPIFKELTQHPVSFLGGFVSGILRLNLADEPVKTWLDGQYGSTSFTATTNVQNGKTTGGGPQTISID